ncbi:MAG: SRPBCC family protein [Hyphomicrobiaceae bacterium]|nr:SRPBCC family protein [Hyphomicrobiaceae bacterium]
MHIDDEIEIKAAPETVFAMLSRIECWPHIIPAIVDVEVVTSGPVQSGTRFLETRDIHGRRETVEMTVAEYEAPRRLVMTAEAHGTRYRIAHDIDGERERTLLRISFSGEPVSIAARLLAPIGTLFAPSVRQHIRSDLEALRRAVELDQLPDAAEAPGSGS